ncbi:MAG: YHYH protein [Flavobacteriales bacterium]|nr:YHYH protein [Flavobacteriales bacterium]
MKNILLLSCLIVLSFSCNKNNDDDNEVLCQNDNSTDQNSHQCTTTPTVSSNYSESINGNNRVILTNGIPSHDYRNQIPNIVANLNASNKTYVIDKNPALASSITSLVKPDGSPNYAFGVALNGVKIDPAPGEPFIFEDETGAYNWDWVMEPNNNMEAVGLDCAVAHVQPNGEYHYHGDMGIYADQLAPNVGTGSAIPTDFVPIGWAADGFPIVYKYGPNSSGDLVVLNSSWQLKSGNRPGDGLSEPCGEYNGKYTNDYEFVSGTGDLDECNGIVANVTIGGETFNYYYVITDAFPVISRCISGAPSVDFKIGP